MGKRIDAIDYAKAIAIWLIVTGHVIRRGPVMDFTSMAGVPCFFFLSGLTHRIVREGQSGKGAALWKRFRQLMVPYFIVGFLSIVLYRLMGQVAAGSLNVKMKGNFLTNLLELLYANSKNGHMKWNESLWFIPCFFATLCLAELAERIIRARVHSLQVSAAAASMKSMREAREAEGPRNPFRDYEEAKTYRNMGRSHTGGLSDDKHYYDDSISDFTEVSQKNDKKQDNDACPDEEAELCSAGSKAVQGKKEETTKITGIVNIIKTEWNDDIRDGQKASADERAARVLVMAVSLMIGYLLTQVFDVRLPWQLETAFNMLPVYETGILMQERYRAFHAKMKKAGSRTAGIAGPISHRSEESADLKTDSKALHNVAGAEYDIESYRDQAGKKSSDIPLLRLVLTASLSFLAAVLLGRLNGQAAVRNDLYPNYFLSYTMMAACIIGILCLGEAAGMRETCHPVIKPGDRGDRRTEAPCETGTSVSRVESFPDTPQMPSSAEGPVDPEQSQDIVKRIDDGVLATGRHTLDILLWNKFPVLAVQVGAKKSAPGFAVLFLENNSVPGVLIAAVLAAGCICLCMLWQGMYRAAIRRCFMKGSF